MKILYLDFELYSAIFEWKSQSNNRELSFLVWVKKQENIEACIQILLRPGTLVLQLWEQNVEC